jgi:hypothetical protein
MNDPRYYLCTVEKNGCGCCSVIDTEEEVTCQFCDAKDTMVEITDEVQPGA